MHDNLLDIKHKINQAFDGFIANEDAVYSIKRSLVVAFAQAADGQPLAMPKTFLLAGPPSVGKSDLARRITGALGLPFVRLDGRAVRSREHLFDMVDDALLAQKPPVRATPNGEMSGMPLIEYPPFAAFVDEVHLVSERTQEAFLTLLESDDRTLLLNGEKGRRVAVVRQAAFIFATTKPADLNRAFRSRCIEIQLRKYTTEEVETMLRRRFGQLPDSALQTIASCSRQIPRVAFAMAGELVEEILWSDDGDIRACVRRVMHGRGVRFANGVTLDDLRYLRVLQHEHRPIGENILKAQLYDIDPLRLSDDIEPFLLSLGFLLVTSKGRQLTAAGERFLKRAEEIQTSDRPVPNKPSEPGSYLPTSIL
jgi:Holliday junction resolvasome RuvABC ATP-dependent DNA helicase subunit